ncbi:MULTISPECIES: peptidase M50 [Metallosphaera]|uniref:Peptidase M50 n=3 Tax=Metallosphaera TaxID=41980 RepID=A4YIQ6_METS5|nr:MULTISPECIES: peptidase M50 [Metallosphaera]ABP96308.1 peptidase M50 [Metallosphaera sedula DSM 5348]AIM28291.1 peptidase M50 [Metallosphaera sedula]AKV75094.1 peptidase M50 [Metallosphaera sedula]AKV77333.1 peptidase M50 [Metallosphaera sedula]AKV79583.1 peptidase M50 [Metallosphaera sedula]
MSWLREWEWRFSRLNEIESFLLAIFSIAVKGISLYLLSGFFGFGVIAALVAATIAIVPHELAHRQSARRYGCYSRFTLNFTGFLFTTIINLLPFFGLVFFSGYTLISCRFFSADKRIEGITAAAGPATNIAISVLFLLGAIAVSNPLLAFFLQVISGFNAVVAFFNLLPFWILDGLKVFRWNIGVWIVLIALSLVLMYFTGEI